MSAPESSALERAQPSVTYGWSADGKTPAEIAGDARQTRYRLEADLRALREKLRPRRIVRRALKARWPVAAAAALAALTVLIRRRRG